jgi:hypothetical protein
MTRFEVYCEKKRQQYGDKFVPPKGKDFINAYNMGEDYRVYVRTRYPSGDTISRWGYVGLTTGWQPCFLLMRNSRAFGSSDTLEDGRDVVMDWHWLTRKRRA